MRSASHNLADARAAEPRPAVPAVLPRIPRWPAAVGLLLVVLAASRAHQFGNPIAHIDDQFYLFAGQAMLDGELPYVDFWDRKPIGLFLIYAGIAALGGSAAFAYHMVAAAFAFGAAILVLKLGERVAGWTAGVRAAIAYLILLATMGGASGQAPVFYNLPMAAAALLAFDAFVGGSRPIRSRALIAMALCGLAIQIKPTALFEGVFFALLFLAAEWRSTRRIASVAGLAATMGAVALAPTAAAFAAYASMGHFDEMWTATVLSNFTKSALPWADRLPGIRQLLIYLAVPIVMAVGAVALELRRTGPSRLGLFIAGWLAAATAGYLSVPNFFDHYALPLVTVLAVAMAPLLGDRRDGLLWLILAVAIPALRLSAAPVAAFRDHSELDRLVETARRELKGGCLYVYAGPTALYTATGACRLSPFVFPDHLETEIEARALPVAPEAEVERIFARRPAAVVTQPRLFVARNNATAAIVERHLACEYRLAGRFDVSQKPEEAVSLWTRREAVPSSCAPGAVRLGIIQRSGG